MGRKVFVMTYYNGDVETLVGVWGDLAPCKLDAEARADYSMDEFVESGDTVNLRITDEEGVFPVKYVIESDATGNELEAWVITQEEVN